MAHLLSRDDANAGRLTLDRAIVKDTPTPERTTLFVLSTSQTNEGRGTFFKVRVFLLLTTLLVVVFVAAGDVRRRKGRNDWDRTLEVAIVLVAPRPLDPKAVAALRDRVPSLERRLAEEAARHRPGLTSPFKFRVAGPVVSDVSAPKLAGTGPSDLASHAWALRSYTKAIDEAAGLDEGAFDARIYVTATPPTSAQKAWIEGESEQGGRIGIVAVELDEGMVDLALAVIAHETFHTLGATDKYDPGGHATIPAGLADPTSVPLYPQLRGDVMARGRVISPGSEQIVERLDDLGVGPETAREIGWRRE